MMRVISYPNRKKDRGPRRPAWWRTFWMPTGTIVENDGVLWVLEIRAADVHSWREWVRRNPPGLSDLDDIVYRGIGPIDAVDEGEWR